MEPEICKKMLRKMSEKLRAKFPVTTLNLHGKNCHLDDAFSEILELEVSPGEDQSLQQKDKKRRKRESEKKNLNLKQKA